ncbi:hypothetical protein SLEP1_g3657 [Rubroshorea leprosula]|uniref:Uncharacterized protein n=1 Tax=Rubroshorea leprosula TaxID=152421 RepID=A0AAV5HQG3_9ROSI|nr:hypothetical protein SLEP1_g3657 [Rubroshorea leprosula]
MGDFWAFFACRRPLPPCSSGFSWKILVPDRSIS